MRVVMVAHPGIKVIVMVVNIPTNQIRISHPGRQLV
jgi:hypothetical protein